MDVWTISLWMKRSGPCGLSSTAAMRRLDIIARSRLFASNGEESSRSFSLDLRFQLQLQLSTVRVLLSSLLSHLAALVPLCLTSLYLTKEVIAEAIQYESFGASKLQLGVLCHGSLGLCQSRSSLCSSTGAIAAGETASYHNKTCLLFKHSI